MLRTALERLVSDYALGNPIARLTVVDQGCGLLRNVPEIRRFANTLVLVDTHRQLTKKHSFCGHRLTIQDFVKTNWPRDNIRVLTAEQFETTTINADVILSVCVLDAVPPRTRARILRAAQQNLADNGVLVAIVPRNDSWTLHRCAESNSYADGYILRHANAYTFYKNWDTKTFAKLLRRNGFSVERDMSVYRHACMLCRKTTQR